MLRPVVSVVLTLALTSCGSDELFVAKRGQPIVGGTPAGEGYLPAVGALVAYGYGNMVESFCTGTLISDRLVLSAAHCVEAIGQEIPAGVPIGFFMGTNTRSSGAASKVLRFKTWKAHPSYQGGNPPGSLSDWYDISVLELETPTSITPMKMLQPAQTSQLKAGAGLLIAGYGMTNPTNQYSSGAKYYGSTAVQQVAKSEIWIMSQKGSQKCNGDSGGPSMIDEGDEDYRIVGVASRAGEGCVYGSVETRVDAYLSWIHSNGSIPCGSGLSEPCAPDPKRTFGQACTKNEQCEGNLCLGELCTQFCTLGQAGCAAGYSCVPVAGRSDGACVKQTAPPPTKAIGEACEASSECSSGLCSEAAGSRLCSQPCTVEVGCGDDALECVPDSAGELACAPRKPPAATGGSGGGCSSGGAPRPTGLAALLAALSVFCLVLPGRRRR